MTQALYFIVKTLAQLFLLLLLLRFWLPWLRADFRNPIAQGILRFTSPLVVPLRRFLPAIGRLDTATVRIVTENLTIINRAIAEAERALRADPANAYVRQHLTFTTQRKRELLRRTAALAAARG